MQVSAPVPTVNIIKSVYGKDKYTNKESQQYGSSFVVGWYILGFDTLESLEQKYSNEEILELWKIQKNN